jgi:hypothetical protein
MRNRGLRLLLPVLLFAAIIGLQACGGGTGSTSGSQGPGNGGPGSGGSGGSGSPSTSTVHVTWIDTHWSDGKVVDRPFDWSITTLQLAVLVPKADGSFQTITGSVIASGRIDFPAVPTGYYWLVLSTKDWKELFWTNSRTFELGTDYNTPATLPDLGFKTETQFQWRITGIDSIQDAYVEAVLEPLNLGFGRTLNAGDGGAFPGAIVGGTFDWTKLTHARVMEYEPVQMGQISGFVTGPAATLDDVHVVNAATNTFDAVLTHRPKSSLDLLIRGSAWVPLFQQGAAGGVTPASTEFGVAVDPEITSDRAAFSHPVKLVQPDSVPPLQGWTDVFGKQLAVRWSCSPSLPSPAPRPLPVATYLMDTDLGTVQYEDPYPSTWTRYLHVCQRAAVKVPSADGSSTMQTIVITNGLSRSTLTGAVEPVMSAVNNPTIDDVSLFTRQSISSITPTIKWSNPSMGSPVGYTVRVLSATTPASGTPFYATSVTLNTATSSVTLPPGILEEGKTYLFMITALADGRANFETQPRRTGFPMAHADLLSAPVTISAQ